MVNLLPYIRRGRHDKAGKFEIIPVIEQNQNGKTGGSVNQTLAWRYMQDLDLDPLRRTRRGAKNKLGPLARGGMVLNG